MLTNEQKLSILHLSDSGKSCTEIADLLGLSRNTVKSVCYRNRNTDKENTCKYCGKPIKQLKGKKPKVFCCRECSIKWWNEDNKSKPFHKECANCGVKFISYGNKDKRYCSRKCYCEHVKRGDSYDGRTISERT